MVCASLACDVLVYAAISTVEGSEYFAMVLHCDSPLEALFYVLKPLYQVVGCFGKVGANLSPPLAYRHVGRYTKNPQDYLHPKPQTETLDTQQARAA